jgi:hypothetical protein
LEARQEAEREHVIAIAHQTETFARVKHLRDLGEYLVPPKPQVSQREGSAQLIKMFKRLQEKGAPVKVERIIRERKP